MPIFEKPPLDTLNPARDRWTPIYLEHGRLEVDDASVKWIGADRTVLRIPVASLSAVMLGPGTTTTHAAIKACSDSNTPVCWVGEEGMRFYAFGISPTHENSNARKQAKLHASPKRRSEIARKMFNHRFDEDVGSCSVQQLRGMEGARVRRLYQDLGIRHGVTWKGRDYDPSNWHIADGINRAISIANSSLYALCASVICSMGFLPTLGFIHEAGTTPLVFDIADLYKHETSFPAAFHACSLTEDPSSDRVLEVFKGYVEEAKLLSRIPLDLNEILR